jgi:tRNA threonylcarbamoyladenosine biosynthesis protein TsaE
MKNLVLKTNSLDETHALGAKLGKYAEKNMVYLLDGDLGAGKTALTQGIAKGLGVKRAVTSPTFTIQKIYHGRMNLYHIDAYRLEGITQDLGFDEYFSDDGLTVIEWSEFMPYLIPDEYLKVSIKLLEENSREFTFVAKGKQYENLLEELK